MKDKNQVLDLLAEAKAARNPVMEAFYAGMLGQPVRLTAYQEKAFTFFYNGGREKMQLIDGRRGKR